MKESPHRSCAPGEEGEGCGSSNRGDQRSGPDCPATSLRPPSSLPPPGDAAGTGEGSGVLGRAAARTSTAWVRGRAAGMRDAGGGVVRRGAMYGVAEAGAAAAVCCAADSSGCGDSWAATPVRENTTREATSQRGDRGVRAIHDGRACRGRQPRRREKARRMKRCLLPGETVETTGRRRSQRSATGGGLSVVTVGGRTPRCFRRGRSVLRGPARGQQTPRAAARHAVPGNEEFGMTLRHGEEAVDPNPVTTAVAILAHDRNVHEPNLKVGC